MFIGQNNKIVNAHPLAKTDHNNGSVNWTNCAISRKWQYKCLHKKQQQRSAQKRLKASPADKCEDSGRCQNKIHKLRMK